MKSSNCAGMFLSEVWARCVTVPEYLPFRGPLPRIRIEHRKVSFQITRFLSHAVSGSVGSAEFSFTRLHPRLIGGPTVNSISGRFHNMFVCRGSSSPRQKTVFTRDAFETLCETLIQDCGSPSPLSGGHGGYKVSEVRARIFLFNMVE